MKQKIFKITKLFVLLLLIALAGCEKDLYEEGLKESGKSIIQKVNLEQIPIIKQSIEDKKSKKSLTSKENASIYLDLINSESINVLTQNDGLKSYTFSLNVEETNLMTNLVIQETSNDLEYYLIKYSSENIAQWKSDLINKVPTEITPSIDFQELDAPITNLTQNKICTEVTTFWVCPSGYHLWGEQGMCDFGFDEWNLQTTFTDINCGGTSSGSSNPNPGGGGSYSSTLAVPCKKITNQLTSKPLLKPALVTLAGTTSQNHENGIFIENTATATTPVQSMPNTATAGGSIKLEMNPTNKYTMIAHTHDAFGSKNPPIGTYSIFSWDDLTTINNLIVNNHIDTSDFVFYVITADGTRYALTIDEPTLLSDFFYNPANVFGATINLEKLAKMDKVFKTYYDKDTGTIKQNSTSSNDLIEFLKFMKEANLGITLFEVDATFTTFNKLSLNSNGTLNKKGC